MNPLEKQFTLADALASLRPGSEWYCQSPLILENVVWQDPVNAYHVHNKDKQSHH